jgi:hypothetical protein
VRGRSCEAEFVRYLTGLADYPEEAALKGQGQSCSRAQEREPVRERECVCVRVWCAPKAATRRGSSSFVGNTFNSSAMVLGAPRLGPPGHFDIIGDLYTGKNIPRTRPYLKILGVRSTARPTIEDGPVVKSGQKAHFCNAIVYESYAGSPKPPPPELCPRPISRPIASPDTSWATTAIRLHPLFGLFFSAVDAGLQCTRPNKNLSTYFFISPVSNVFTPLTLLSSLSQACSRYVTSGA